MVHYELTIILRNRDIDPLKEKVKEIFSDTRGVVDVDWFQEEPRIRQVLTVDKEKAQKR